MLKFLLPHLVIPMSLPLVQTLKASSAPARTAIAQRSLGTESPAQETVLKSVMDTWPSQPWNKPEWESGNVQEK